MIRDGAIQAAAAAVTSQWRDGPPVSVVRTAADLALELPHDVEALYRNGEVTLIADALNPIRAVAVVGHEGIGHYGLRQLLGRAWTGFMGGVLDGSRNDPLLSAARSHVERVYVGDGGACNLTQRQLADEIAAALAERRMSIATLGLAVDRPAAKQLAALRGHLARELLLLDVPACAAQVEGALLLAERRVRHGRAFFGCMARAMDWYHRPMARKFDPLARPMTMQQSEDLLRGAESRENYFENLKVTGWVLFALLMLGVFLASVGWILLRFLGWLLH